MIFNVGAAAAGGYPEFTYSGEYTFIEDSDKDWRIKFLTSGKLTFTKLGNAKKGIDVFLVGGGGSGGYGTMQNGYTIGFACGGSGGYNTLDVATPEKSAEYEIVVGAGASKATARGKGKTGGTSSAFGFEADGGGGGGVIGWNSWPYIAGDPGGSGGGGEQGNGVSNGSDGTGDYATEGSGVNSYEFREESSGTLYGGGGIGGKTNENQGNYPGDGGGGTTGASGETNTGGGGGGTWDYNPGGTGGSGIVIIRNRRAS